MKHSRQLFRQRNIVIASLGVTLSMMCPVIVNAATDTTDGTSPDILSVSDTASTVQDVPEKSSKAIFVLPSQPSLIVLPSQPSLNIVPPVVPRQTHPTSRRAATAPVARSSVPSQPAATVEGAKVPDANAKDTSRATTSTTNPLLTGRPDKRVDRPVLLASARKDNPYHYAQGGIAQPLAQRLYLASAILASLGLLLLSGVIRRPRRRVKLFPFSYT